MISNPLVRISSEKKPKLQGKVLEVGTNLYGLAKMSHWISTVRTVPYQVSTVLVPTVPVCVLLIAYYFSAALPPAQRLRLSPLPDVTLCTRQGENQCVFNEVPEDSKRPE